MQSLFAILVLVALVACAMGQYYYGGYGAYPYASSYGYGAYPYAGYGGYGYTGYSGLNYFLKK